MSTSEGAPEEPTELPVSGPDQGSESKPQKPDSSRLPLSRRILDPNHPGMQYLRQQLPEKLKLVGNIDATWTTISEMLKDQRRIILRFPFTEETVEVTIKTYVKILYQGLLKKGRFPLEERFYIMALQAATDILLWDPEQKKSMKVTQEGTAVKKDLVQKNANRSKNPFLLRANNTIATLELDEEVWAPYIRAKITNLQEQDRDEIIPDVSETEAMLYTFNEAMKREGLTDIERLHLFLLLIDPTFAAFPMSFDFRGVLIKQRFRFLMKEAIRYAIGVTYYSEDIDEDLRRDLVKSYATRVHNAVIGNAFKQKRQREVAPELLQDIDDRVSKLLGEEGSVAQIQDLESLESPSGMTWKLPNDGQRRILQNLKDIASRDDFILYGLMAFLAREEQKREQTSE